MYIVLNGTKIANPKCYKYCVSLKFIADKRNLFYDE